MSFMFLKNCFNKKCIAIFVNWLYSIFLIQSIQRTVFSAVRFLLSSLIANIQTILINFQPNLLFKSFQHIAIKFLTKKIFCMLKKCFKIFVKLARKMRLFFLCELYLTVDPSYLMSENDVTQHAEFQMHV